MGDATRAVAGTRPKRDVDRDALERLGRDAGLPAERLAGCRDVTDLLAIVREASAPLLRDGVAEPVASNHLRTLEGFVRFVVEGASLLTAETEATSDRHGRELDDVSDRLGAALEETQRARERLIGVLSAVDSPVLILDGERSITRVNRAAAEALAADLVGSSGERYCGNVASGEDGEVELEFEGRRGVFLVSRRPLPQSDGEEVVVLHDITERERRAAERHEADTIAELERAIRVIAHKINNPLTAMLGRAQLLRMSSGDDPRVERACRVIEDAARRVSVLIRELASVVHTGSASSLDELLAMETGADRPGGTPRKTAACATERRSGER